MHLELSISMNILTQEHYFQNKQMQSQELNGHFEQLRTLGIHQKCSVGKLVEEWNF